MVVASAIKNDHEIQYSIPKT